MSEKKKLDWKELGKFVPKALDLFMLIRSVFESKGIGLEIVGWLTGEGKHIFHEHLKILSKEFLVAKSKFPEIVKTFSLKDLSSTLWAVDSEGNTHLTVTSNGMTGEEWEQYFKRCGCQMDDWSRGMLHCVSEAPTNGVTYHIVMPPSHRISLSRDNPVNKKIRAVAEECGWVEPHWEVACLLCEKFTAEQFKQIGLTCIVTMHEPIEDSDPNLGPMLFISGWNNSKCCFSGISGGHDYNYHCLDGFAFVVP